MQFKAVSGATIIEAMTAAGNFVNTPGISPRSASLALVKWPANKSAHHTAQYVVTIGYRSDGDGPGSWSPRLPVKLALVGLGDATSTAGVQAGIATAAEMAGLGFGDVISHSVFVMPDDHGPSSLMVMFMHEFIGE